jgi:hypothetical protein
MARALLQLLVPGLVRVAARWRCQLGGTAAGWEVISRAGVDIGSGGGTGSGGGSGWGGGTGSGGGSGWDCHGPARSDRCRTPGIRRFVRSLPVVHFVMPVASARLGLSVVLVLANQ